jgi:putative DNA primase/helicase
LSAQVTEQVLFIAYGTGANGKSTLFELLHMILGDYSKMADFETFVTGKKSDVRTMEAIGELKGIRFALASEIDSSKRFDEALIKKLTGGDTLRGTALRSSAFQFSPEFKIWLLTNHLPFARDGSHGFWRRIKVIPFKQTFRGDDMQSNLLGRLSTERNGILKWCVEGAAKYFHKVRHEETGLGPCKAIDEATAAYRYDNDTASRFIEEVVEAKEGEQVQARALFSAYESWSFEEGIKYPISEQIFSRRMEERGFEKKRTSEATFYRGISLKKEFRGNF